jgi:hypothetical protein
MRLPQASAAGCAEAAQPRLKAIETGAGPKIGFDIFRFENGKIAEHWDTIEEIPARGAWKNDNGKFQFSRREQ